MIQEEKKQPITRNGNTHPTLKVHRKTIIHVMDFRYLGSMMAFGASDLKRLIRMVHTLRVGAPVEEPSNSYHNNSEVIQHHLCDDFAKWM